MITLGLDFADPRELPFGDVPVEVFDHAIGLAASLQVKRRVLTDRPEFLDDDKLGVQVLLVEDHESAFAWVGTSGSGTLVGFVPSDPVPFGLATPGMGWVATAALGWFMDMCVSSKHYAEADTVGGVRRWRPKSAWRTQYGDVVAGARVPPMPHYVRPHVRTYDTRYGSKEARSRAPEAIRRLMGLHDTWVRGYSSGQLVGPEVVRENLRRASALADLLASVERVQSA
jgi:hypothetical protein